MAFGLDGDGESPVWLPWLQLGATTLLAVLFVMLLIKSRDQNQRLQQLDVRLQGIENNRSLDRSAALEQQIRTLAERMRSLEGQRQELEATRRERDEMRSELRQLRATTPVRPPSTIGSPPVPPPPLPGSAAPVLPPELDGRR